MQGIWQGTQVGRIKVLDVPLTAVRRTASGMARVKAGPGGEGAAVARAWNDGRAGRNEGREHRWDTLRG